MKSKHKLHKRTPINNVNISLAYLKHVLKDWKVFCKSHPRIKQAIQNVLDYVEQLSNEKETLDRSLAFNIISVFENVLDSYNIDIPSEERIDAVNAGESDVARIYGHTYYYLEDKIVEMLEQHNNVKGGLTSEHFNTV